jgi:hypothetical protein
LRICNNVIFHMSLFPLPHYTSVMEFTLQAADFMLKSQQV